MVVFLYLKRWRGVIGGHNTSMIFRRWKVVGWVGILRSLGPSETLWLVTGTVGL